MQLNFDQTTYFQTKKPVKIVKHTTLIVLLLHEPSHSGYTSQLT
jgi:hypothetical protein